MTGVTGSTGMSEAVRVAAQRAHGRLPRSFLNAPAVLGVTGGVMGRGGHSEAGDERTRDRISPAGRAIRASRCVDRGTTQEMPQPLGFGTVPEVAFVVVFVVMLLPACVWVWISNGTGWVLARTSPPKPG